MILIVGCGFLGSHLLKYASTQTDDNIIATIRDFDNIPIPNAAEYIKCDITDIQSLSTLAHKCGNKPLTVFYFAACHNVDYVYEHPDKAKEINIDALNNFFDIIPNIKKFFFASTDCVYGEGINMCSKFSETSPLLPINEYGRQKAEAEQIVLSKGFTVLRLPFMLGPSLTSKPHFYDNICDKLINGNSIEMIDGMTRSVLSYEQTAELIYSLSVLPNAIPQIINVCSDSELSKYDIGLILAKNLNVSSDLVKSISENDGRKFFKDTRALYAAMDNYLLKNLLNIENITWDECSDKNTIA